VPGQDGWIKPKHGHGIIRPWQPGNKLGGQRPGRYLETQQLARDHSLEAVRTLVERLRDPDGRIAVVAANSILERAWGKVREQKPEEPQKMQIDLTTLTAAELAILFKLAESGRLRSVPSEGEDQAPPVIESKPDPQK
jgi:hypothetical protein